ncbi:hypothetical protein FPSE_07082 [Fusarium pseudograminearum CS3096]|uniref:Uncharacterized protein n=1 Tax=Fusarium pseudograminearum (strain CS3096) TaxID=1028729 RepID=K3VEU7_FUSPC|nr:hypothetical protein FPSE_07082 [Fusarium pseudograminearum CS3096]EKJ72682.1 hypothetical protein FPSE_07082 [Fusarium pseudograminearum CS3096]
MVVVPRSHAIEVFKIDGSLDADD